MGRLSWRGLKCSNCFVGTQTSNRQSLCRGGKAAEGRRTPGRSREVPSHCGRGASWTAPVLWRFSPDNRAIDAPSGMAKLFRPCALSRSPFYRFDNEKGFCYWNGQHMKPLRLLTAALGAGLLFFNLVPAGAQLPATEPVIPKPWWTSHGWQD